MLAFFTIIHVLLCVFMIFVILLQPGKDAGMGAALGGGAATSAFGGRGAVTFLSKLTAVCAALFFLTSLGLSFVGVRGLGDQQPGGEGGGADCSGGGSRLGAAPAPASSAPPGPAAPAAAPGSGDGAGVPRRSSRVARSAACKARRPCTTACSSSSGRRCSPGASAVCLWLSRRGLARTYVRDVLHVGAGVWPLGWGAWQSPWPPVRGGDDRVRAPARRSAAGAPVRGGAGARASGLGRRGGVVGARALRALGGGVHRGGSARARAVPRRGGAARAGAR